MTTSLYERLGGADGISQLVGDAVDAHLANPVVGTRFRNATDIKAAKRKSFEFFCAGSGGPETYTGKDMLTAHTGMNISEQEYLAVMDDIIGAMERNGVGPEEQKDVIAILYSLKDQIIRQ